MAERETSPERDGAQPEAVRREDGAGRREPHPAGEAARGNVEPEVEAPHATEETWTPEEGTQTSDPSRDAD